jgi:cysteine desulfurase/selenocysteine lyase
MTAVGTATRGRRVNGRRAAADRELNVDAIRKEFPALAQRVHGHPLVYLDSAATTHRPLAVLEAIDEFYGRDNSNTHSEIHELGKRAMRTQMDARKTVAKFLNAETHEEVASVRGTTEGINVIARTWAEEHVGSGDNIVLTIYNTTHEIDRFVDALRELRG